MRSYEEIAYLLMVALKRSEKSRFRLSRKSLQEISGRDVLRSGLIANISEWMEGYAVILPLNRGGYVVVSQDSLEGVPSIKFPDVVTDWKTLTIQQMRDEFGEDDDDEDA